MEEKQFNSIYSKTYNFVYLRAKSMMKTEAEVRELMEEIYLKMLASPEEISEEHIFEWLGKCAYTLGSLKYHKKRAREVAYLEIDEEELEVRKNDGVEQVVEVILERIEELPYLYQATFYAFYYDHMSVDEIAGVMDETKGVIRNRLNYTRKYMIEALSELQPEDSDEDSDEVMFSVWAVKEALKQWSSDNCLGITKAQFVYSEICKKMGWKSTAITLDGKEFAGVNNTIVDYEADDWSALEAQFGSYQQRFGMENRGGGVIIGVTALVIAIIVGCILFAMAGRDDSWGQQQGSQNKQNEDINRDDNADNDVNNEDQNNEDQNNGDQNNEDQNNEDQNNEDQNSENTDGSNPDNGENSDNQTSGEQNQGTDEEYILSDSGTRPLQRSELEHLTKEELRLARNEIFARHGMIFGVEDLDQYFASKSWYQPTITVTEFYDQVDMSMIEEENINLIVEVEAEKSAE